MNISLTCPEHGIHDPWMPRTARGLKMAGFTDQEIFDVLREATIKARRTVPDNEILKTITTIRGTATGALAATAEKTVYEPAYLEERAARIPDTVDDAYLEARSQYTVWNRTPAGFLHKIFQPGENAWVTTNDKSSDGLIWTHDGARQQFDELAHVQTGQYNVWYLTNPVDAELHALNRLQSKHNPEGLTFRASRMRDRLALHADRVRRGPAASLAKGAGAVRTSDSRNLSLGEKKLSRSGSPQCQIEKPLR